MASGDTPKRSTPRSSRHRENASSSKLSPKPNANPTTSKQQQQQQQQQLTPNKPYPNPSHLGPIQPPGPTHAQGPTYGFQMLDRRTIVLVDGSVRSYFALPPDYRDPLPPPRLNPAGTGGYLGHPMKRKFEDDRERDMDRDRNEFVRQKQQHLLHYGNAGLREGLGSAGKVDPAVMKAFLNFVKVIYENDWANKHGPVQCLVCGGSSKHFPDVHSLVMHAYNSDNADSRADHLGLHRALCAVMGWNCMRAPDNSMMYQFLPPSEAAAFQDDLIMWPPMVIIHNTGTGKGKDGRMEGLGNKAMDSELRDLGFAGGKPKSLYNREGHLGITLIKFAGDQLGLKEAICLSDYFEKERHGRRDWAHLQSLGAGRDDEKNPNLVMLNERNGSKRRILYGYLLTASDIDKVDHETRKKVVIESKLEKLHASKSSN